MSNRTHFLLLASPRCGSNMLRLALCEHPAVRCCLIYNNGGPNPTSHGDWEEFHQGRHPQAVTHLGTFVFRHDTAWLKRHCPDAAGFWKLMQRQHSRYVCLRRTNLLRQYLSMTQAGHTPGARESLKPRAKIPKPRVLSPSGFSLFACMMQRLAVDIDSCFPGRLTVTYEQLADSWAATFHRVQRYLGLPVQKITPRTFRQETRPLCEAIANYETMAECVTQYGHPEWLD